MNEKKKGFNLFPEYVWMIFVGMLLAILILTNVIPGHAEEVTPIPTPAVEDPRYNYATYIFAQNNSVFILGPDHSFIELPSPHDYQVNNNTEALERLRLDYVRSLDTLFDFIPAAETTIYYADENASIGTLNFLISVLDPFDCYFMYEYSDSAYVPDYSDSTQYTFISAPCGPYNIGVYKKNTLITPSATPTPLPPQEEYYVLVPPSSSATWKDNYMFTINASGVNSVFVQPQDSTWSSLKTSFPDLTTDLRYNAVVFKTDRYTGSWLGGYYGRTAIFYFQVASYSDVKLYYYRGSVVSDPEVMKSVASVSDGVITDSSNYSSPSYYVQQLDNGGYCIAFVFRYGEYGDPNFAAYSSDIWFQTYSFTDNNRVNYSLPFQQNSVQYSNSLKLRLDASGTAVPDPNITPTPEPTATPVPLPTSGESIHVILPSGTPTPTPPFYVPGGSDGGTGSGSPGSIGSGLSSQQTSGILEYWSSFVSDNPAMLFLTSTFQALPPELLYPLYILLFILLLLAVIRLFVHFSGG